MWKPGPYDPDWRALEPWSSAAQAPRGSAWPRASTLRLRTWKPGRAITTTSPSRSPTLNRLARSEWERRPIEALATGKPFQVGAWARLYTTLFGRAALS